MNKMQRFSIVFVVLALLLAAPYIGLPVHVQSLLYVIFFWMTLATSWNMLSGYSGYFSFGHGAFFGVGMYGMATLAAKADWPVVPAALGSGVLAALLALAIGALVFNLRKIRGESFALITMAVGFVLATVVVNTPIDGGPGVYLMGVSLPQWGPKPASTFYYASLVLTVLCVAAAWWLFHARAGLGLLAIHDDEDAAEVNGVPTFWLKMGAFALSSFFAGVMGAIHALYVSYVTVGETFNITVPLTVVLMSVLGGSRHWAGPMLGGILITLLLNAFTAGDSALIGKVIIGLVLAGAVLVMPRGILGTWQLRQHKRLIQQSKDASADLHAPDAGSEEALVIERPLSRPAEAADRTPVLQVRGLSKQFSGIRALNRVDLDLYQGEILGLLGPNGSGKSTFINVVTGHYKPTEGSVVLRGQSCAGWPAHRIRRQGLSRTYQIPRPFNGLTVLQNVTLAAHYGGARLTDAQAQAEAQEWMLFTGLQDKGDHFPDELNLHQRKFLELARALAARPQVLLLDEVLSGLTPSEIGAAVQTIRRIRERGTSIVFVEHVMSAVLALSDRLVVLNQGEVIAEGPPQDVMSRPEVVRAYLGDEAAV
jgi:branched-chain amino acid transport system permease protein